MPSALFAIFQLVLLHPQVTIIIVHFLYVRNKFSKIVNDKNQNMSFY